MRITISKFIHRLLVMALLAVSFNTVALPPPIYVITGPITATTGTQTTYSVTVDFDEDWINPVWEISPALGTVISSTVSADLKTATATINWTATGVATITAKNGGGCCVVDTHTVTISCTAPAPPLDVTTDKLFTTGTITLKVAVYGLSNYTVKWYNDAAASGSVLATGLSYSPSISATTTFYATVTDNTIGCASATTPVIAQIVPVTVPGDIRSVKQEIIRKSESVEANIASLSEAQKTVAMAYVDGLGRIAQQVITKASPGGYDMVQPVEYTAQGPIKSYMPYKAATATGEYHPAPITETNGQAAFYQATNDKIANDNYPFSQTIVEDSPLGRVKQQVPAGQTSAGGHTFTTTYSYNNGSSASDLEEVRKFSVDGSSSGFCPAYSLQRIESTDANGNREVTFIDARGLVLARKKELSETIGGVTVSWLQTYYIYDDFHRLKYIISPKGQVALKANSWVLSTTIKDSYVYQFVYDRRGRIIEKKTPGQAWAYFVYDNLNRLVLSQDGMLRTTNQWAFIRYDQRGRAVMQGLYKNTVNTTRATVQSIADDLYKSSNVAYPVDSWYEKRGATLEGYTSISFPKTNQDGTALDVLGVIYYDDYDLDLNGTADKTYTAQGLSGEGTATSFVRGMPTVSKRKILGTSTWLYSYAFYDAFGRVIQVLSNNHLNTTVNNLMTIVYDFEGKATITKNYHNAGGSNITTVINKYTYDNKGRLLKIHQNNNAAANDQLVVQYEYNELGQVVDKKLHEITLNSGTFLQSVDYRYSILGQLASINNASLTNDSGATNDETTDYFGIEYLYNTVESGLSNTADYNGNISAIKWKGPGMGTSSPSYTTDQRAYKFTYDKSGKLKSAASLGYTGSAWTKESGVHTESMTYDHNGNIVTLQRNQRKHQLSGITASYISESIDNLTYAYNTTIGDQLLKVTDAAALAAGFDNGASSTNNDYTYDGNGNLLTDGNKNITGITYNFLGKPTQIVFGDGRKIDYIYDASGTKLTMKTWQGTTLLTTTDYVNGFVYESNVLSFFGSPEGRVVKNGSALEYQYNIADHQGNTRLVFSSATPTPVAPVATFEGDANDGASQYTVNASFVVSNGSANHTTSGTKVVRMNQTYKIGPSKSIRVFPGDKIDMEVWEYHEGNSGFGTTGTAVGTLITNVAGAFGGVSGGAGDAGAIYNGVNSGVTAFGTGGNQGDSRPAAYLNYILFDKNYKVLDAGWQLAPATTFTKQKLSFATKNINEPGYIFVWLSYDDDSNNWVYFDDFKVTHTKTNVIQYNEYYPFGLQASTSWTRENSKNNFLYNEGSELNTTSGWYDLPFRNYDATLGRFFQVDPLAYVDHSTSPFAYAGNNPVLFNDPSGLYVDYWSSWDNPDYAYAQQQLAEYRQYQNHINDPHPSGGGGIPSIGGFGLPDGMAGDAQRVKTGLMSLSDYTAKYGASVSPGQFGAMLVFYGTPAGTAAAAASLANGLYSGIVQHDGINYDVTVCISDDGTVVSARGENSGAINDFYSGGGGWSFQGKHGVADNGFSWDNFHGHVGAEANATFGLVNFDFELKNGLGVVWREGAEVLGEVSADSYYEPKRTAFRNSTKYVTEYGAYFYGGGSYQSTAEVVNGVLIDENSQINFGAFGFGVQINWDGLGLKDVRFGFDTGFGVSTFLGGKVSFQMGGIYVNRPK